MNWEMIGAIGQVTAAVGLVPTLLCLAVQMREQNRARRLASLDILSAQWGAQAWWRTRRHWFEPETCRLVDAVMSQTGDPTAYRDFAVAVAAQ